MAGLKTSIIIRAVDKLTAPVKKITAATGRLTSEGSRSPRPARVLTERQRELRSQVARATASLVAQTSRLRNWGSAAQTSFGRAPKLLKWTSATFGGLTYTLKRAFVDPVAEFERFETVLTTIEGSSEKARESMNWIDDFAVKTPFQLGQVTDAFVKLRAYGMDPTDGLLCDLGDASAAMGKPRFIPAPAGNRPARGVRVVRRSSVRWARRNGARPITTHRTRWGETVDVDGERGIICR